VPNRQFLPAILRLLNDAGVDDSRIVIIIGTGMHRASSEQERELLVGRDILGRVEVIDHRADDVETLVKVSDEPPVRVCRQFAEVDFRIVTGFIEPHFMAGFSGGRKGVCPALVDLQTIQRFHGYETLSSPNADNGILEGNPCHESALSVARAVGVDFLFNVAITRDRRIAGIYCGDLEEAHLAGCEQVGRWTTAHIDEPFDLVITSGGGYPLDLNFYQTVKGMCGALPVLAEHSTLLQVSHCGEQLGSRAYTELMLSYDNDWRRFLTDIAANRDETRLDQWELQMQARVLARIGEEKLWFVSDGIPTEIQQHIAVKPILGSGDAQARAQRAIDKYLDTNPDAGIAVIPEGPYTMLRRNPPKAD
jgi:nickel-dependent lactate racemase